MEDPLVGGRREQGGDAPDRLRGRGEDQPPRLRRLLAGRSPRWGRGRQQRDRAVPRRRGHPPRRPRGHGGDRVLPPLGRAIANWPLPGPCL